MGKSKFNNLKQDITASDWDEKPQVSSHPTLKWMKIVQLKKQKPTNLKIDGHSPTTETQ